MTIIDPDIIPKSIIRIVAEEFGVTEDELIGKSHKRRFTDPRFVAYRLMKQYTDDTLTAIGARFSGRNHATIIHGIGSLETLLETNQWGADSLRKLGRVTVRVVQLVTDPPDHDIGNVIRDLKPKNHRNQATKSCTYLGAGLLVA